MTVLSLVWERTGFLYLTFLPKGTWLMLLCCLPLSEPSLPPAFESVSLFQSNCLFQLNLTQVIFIFKNLNFPKFPDKEFEELKKHVLKLKETLQCNTACCYWSFYTGEGLINRSCRDTQTRTGAFLNFQSINPDTLTHAPPCFIVVISAQRTSCPPLMKTVTFQHQLFLLPWVSCVELGWRMRVSPRLSVIINFGKMACSFWGSTLDLGHLFE